MVPWAGIHPGIVTFPGGAVDGSAVSECLFLVVLRVDLQSVIVAFFGHSHLITQEKLVCCKHLLSYL